MAPLTAQGPEARLLAPLWQPQPKGSSQHHNKIEDTTKDAPQECDYDISSLALVFVPFPFTSGGITAYTMDASDARRFSASSAERVGLLKAHDNAARQHHYGAITDPSDLESLVGNGAVEELGTTAGQEAKLLFKYSVPLMGTYLLQYSFSLITIFVVGHSKCLI